MLSHRIFTLFLLFTTHADAFHSVAPLTRGLNVNVAGDGSHQLAFVSKKRADVRLHGILDDYNADLASDASSSKKDTKHEGVNVEYERLFEDLVFGSGNIKTAIAAQLDVCTDSGFLQFLVDNKENADDTEEAEALQDILDTIIAVQGEVQAEQIKLQEKQQAKEKAAKERIAQIEATEKADASEPVSSTADVLERANAINHGVMAASAETLEDEQPDNFMRDAKAVRGLAGFSNRGNMRVGGG